MEYLDKESVEVSDGSLPLATRCIACSSMQLHCMQQPNSIPFTIECKLYASQTNILGTLHEGPGASPGSRVLGWAPRGFRVELRTI